MEKFDQISAQNVMQRSRSETVKMIQAELQAIKGKLETRALVVQRVSEASILGNKSDGIE